MPVFDIPLVRRDARPAGSDELGRTIVSVEAPSLRSAIRKAEAEYPRWTPNQDASVDAMPIPDGERLSRVLRIWA